MKQEVTVKRPCLMVLFGCLLLSILVILLTFPLLGDLLLGYRSPLLELHLLPRPGLWSWTPVDTVRPAQAGCLTALILGADPRVRPACP